MQSFNYKISGRPDTIINDAPVSNDMFLNTSCGALSQFLARSRRASLTLCLIKWRRDFLLSFIYNLRLATVELIFSQAV